MKDIISKAKDLKICEEWHGKMQKNPTMGNLCEMYFRGDDWAMENDFPTLELLQKYKGKTEEFGLYMDFKGSLKNIERLGVFGGSDVDLNYDEYVVAKLNIRHNSKAKINLKNNAFLVVNILDNAEVEIGAEDLSKVFVYDYGANTKIKFNGNVIVKTSNFK